MIKKGFKQSKAYYVAAIAMVGLMGNLVRMEPCMEK